MFYTSNPLERPNTKYLWTIGGRVGVKNWFKNYIQGWNRVNWTSSKFRGWALAKAKHAHQLTASLSTYLGEVCQKIWKVENESGQFEKY